MAELAIPLLALFGFYVISQHDKDEPFESMSESFKKVSPEELDDKYIDSHNPSDKYFKKNIIKTVEQNNPKDSVGGSVRTVIGLDGAPIDKTNFSHNNMTPYFGARVKGAGAGPDTSEAQLDNMQGAGSQHIRKVEQAPLFKPESNMSWANGMPSTTEFMLSRQVPSSRMNNVKPWDEEKVAPGLGQGFTTKGSGSGYNAGAEDRGAWLPKNVDQLRVDTNPKVTFDLNGHQGPASYHIKESGNINTIGKIEKNRPDTDYEVGPGRWFTTTGLEKGNTVRSEHLLNHTNRPDYDESNYFGTGGKEGQSTYVNTHINATHRQQLDSPSITVPTCKPSATKNDYGNGSYNVLPNNRSSTSQPINFGPVDGLVKALTSPVLDILRPSRKENILGSIRPSGNVQQVLGGANPVHNPGDRTRTTVREQTEKGAQHQNIQGQTDGGYKVSKHQKVQQERDTTNVQHIGNVAGQEQAMSQQSVYNQRNNPNKTFANTPNQGGMSMFNSGVNVSLKPDGDKQNNRSYSVTPTITTIPSSETYGNIRMPETCSSNQGFERMNPDILTAFKNNPYTHSLNSWA
jgi:hypothetical protein